MNDERRYFAHKTACIDDGASVGEGSKVWHYTHVSIGARVGNNVILGQNVFVGSDATIGDGCKIQNNVSIYDNVTLDERVFCGPSAVFTNVINPRAFIERKNEYLPTHVKMGASIGANATIICGVTIGVYALIGAGAVVREDVKDYALVVGVPAIQVGWVTQEGLRLDLPLTGDGTWRCSATGNLYCLKQGKVTCETIHNAFF
jgi:UDP-2-acetamido-3-amino-2,3-dideoxy-glucuronate N-acetyltransferase